MSGPAAAEFTAAARRNFDAYLSGSIGPIEVEDALDALDRSGLDPVSTAVVDHHRIELAVGVAYAADKGAPGVESLRFAVERFRHMLGRLERGELWRPETSVALLGGGSISVCAALGGAPSMLLRPSHGAEIAVTRRKSGLLSSAVVYAAYDLAIGRCRHGWLSDWRQVGPYTVRVDVDPARGEMRVEVDRDEGHIARWSLAAESAALLGDALVYVQAELGQGPPQADARPDAPKGV